MRFSNFLLPLALVAQTSCASRQCGVGEENCPTVDIPIETMEWVGGFTGLLFLSKTLLLETLISDSRSAGNIGFTMIKDMMIGSDIIHALTQRTRNKEIMMPFDVSQIEGSLVRNFDTWGMQTISFLERLEERAALFRESTPRVMPALATMLKEFEKDIDMFCDAFGTLMPNLAANITEMTGEISGAFADTIDRFNEQ